MTLSLIGIIVALLLAGILAYKNVNSILIGTISTLIIIITSGLNLTETYTAVYQSGVGGLVSSIFLQVGIGALLGQVYLDTGAARVIADRFSKNLKGNSAIIGVVIICGLLQLGGLGFGVFFIMYPIATRLFAKNGIHRYLVFLSVIFSPYTWAQTMPFSTSIYNTYPMSLFGTPSSAGLIPGAAAAIFVGVLGTWWMIRYNKRLIAKNPDYMKLYERDADVLADADNVNGKDIPLILAVIPLLLVFVLFNVLKWNIALALLCGLASSFILFFKQLSLSKWNQALSIGAKSSMSIMITMGALVGIANVVKATPVYTKALELLATSSLNPYLLAGIAGSIIAFILASGTGSITIGLGTLKDVYLGYAARGYNLGNIHRIAAICGSGLDSVPWSGSLISTCMIFRTNIKEVYYGVFVTCTLITMLSQFCIAIPLASLGLH